MFKKAELPDPNDIRFTKTDYQKDSLNSLAKSANELKTKFQELDDVRKYETDIMMISIK